jgi:hypothetical protein
LALKPGVKIDQTLSNKVRFLRSFTPFRCGILGGVNFGIIPHCFR